MAALADQEVDQLEVGLAVVGLGATGLVVVSGGGTVTIKAGASVLRMARQLGTLTPGMMRSLRVASDIPVAWNRLPDFATGRAPLSAVTDTARLSDLGRMAQNVGVIGRNTSTADALVPFDDGMKRFSYGPPAQATRRLLALIDAGVLTLRQVDDPDIECVTEGWRVAEGKDVDTASVMVDSVLSGPVLEKVSSPLLASLRERGTLVPMGEKLGAVVSPDGQVLDDKGRPVAGLSLLGRLATGSVIATDSLHDCFGAAVSRWAARVLGR